MDLPFDYAAEDKVLFLAICLALEPEIGPVLFVDVDPALLHRFAVFLSALAHSLEPDLDVPDVITLGAWTTTEDLWQRFDSVGGRLGLAPGPLVAEPSRPAPILVIPRLGSMGLATAQAFLTEAGERGLRWLAAADRADLASMSPHLLDRFAARVDGRTIAETWQGERLPFLDPRATTLRPRWTADATRQILDLLPPTAGRRLELALAHTARALAVMYIRPSVEATHVGLATLVLGLIDDRPSPEQAPERPTSEAADANPVNAVADSITDDQTGTRHEEVGLPEGTDDLTAETTPPQPWTDSLYPELSPDAVPLLDSLRSPRRGRHEARGPRGTAIGVKPVDSSAGLHDLALSASLVRMRMFRMIGAIGVADQDGAPTSVLDDGFLYSQCLRQYRRSPPNDSTLVLVVDHSCPPGWDWPSLLAPHLRWAYHRSAVVTLIEFGHRDTPDETAAHRVRGRGLVDPAVIRSLSGREPGRASPLAHALDLAAHETRRAARGGRASDEIRLVVLTDGRGNIPLDDSLRGRPPRHTVGREGVEDALLAADTIRGLGRARIRRHVLGPDVDQYPGLLSELATRLAADLRLSPVGRAPSEEGP